MNKSEHALKIISKKNAVFLKGYEEFYSIGNETIVGNGILIHKSTKVLWLRNWGHSFGNIFFHQKDQILIMDRLAMIGPVTTNAGICAVDFKTGKYLWKYWHFFEIFERNGFINQSKSIKFENLDEAKFTDKFIYTNNYKVDIKSGKYYPKDDLPAKSLWQCEIPKKIKLKKTEINFEINTRGIEDGNVSVFFQGNNGIEYFINEKEGVIYVVDDSLLSETFYINESLRDVRAFDFFNQGILLYLQDNVKSKILIILKK